MLVVVVVVLVVVVVVVVVWRACVRASVFLRARACARLCLCVRACVRVRVVRGRAHWHCPRAYPLRHRVCAIVRDAATCGRTAS